MGMIALKTLMALLAIFTLALPAFAVPSVKDVPWVIGPFGRGRLPDWTVQSGQKALDSKESLTLKAEKDEPITLNYQINRDWSGYRALQLKFTGGELVSLKVTLTDPNGLQWVASSKLSNRAEPVKLSFSQFKPVNQDPKAWLDLALLKSAQIEIQFKEGSSKSITLESIALSDSKGLIGPSTNMDVVFDYYKSKPWEQIIQDAKDKGFTGIHLIDVNLQPENFNNLAKKAKVVRDAGMGVALTLYPTTDHASYERHPEWRQKSLNGSSRYDWRTYLCPNNDEFAKYLSDKLTKAFKVCRFDAIELAEPWFEIWGGPEAKTVGGYYTCVCDHCRAKFKAKSGVDPVDLFDKQNQHYFRNNPELYEKWVRFRVDSLEAFMKLCFSSAQKSTPEIATMTMQVSDCRVEPGKAREYQGQDFDSMIKNVVPNALIIESAWQDWLQGKIEPSYIADYGKFYAPRRGKVLLLSQCDIGSSNDAKRGIEWLRGFSSISAKSGFSGYLAYEYSVGLDTTGP